MLKPAHTLLSAPPKSSRADGGLDRELLAAAFACVGLVVAKTQSNEKLYENFVFNDPLSLLQKSLDTQMQYSFPSKLDRFTTQLIGNREGASRLVAAVGRNGRYG